MLQRLGFTIHSQKSSLVPSQSLEFLGFLIDSVNMVITLPERKRDKIFDLCTLVCTSPTVAIRLIARLVGNFIAATDAVPYAPLPPKTIENDKVQALSNSKGDFNRLMTLSAEALTDVLWWQQNIRHSYSSLEPLQVAHTIYCDASKMGWGATCGPLHTNGVWLETEWTDSDINVMELTAAKFALLAFYPLLYGVPVSEDPPPSVGDGNRHLVGSQNLAIPPRSHIRIMMDNTTAISYLNHMGGTKSRLCHALSRDIWLWAEKRRLWLTAAHIPGKENTAADLYSRKFADSKEWSVSFSIFKVISDYFGIPAVDLFASRTNHKVLKYVSWHPDPGSFAVDAFTISWGGFFSYSFPPFSLITRTLKKIMVERADAILIVPLWPTQCWYPMALNLLVDHPLVFRATLQNIFLPHKPLLPHPLSPNLHFMALKLSGDSLKNSNYKLRLRTLSLIPGGPVPSPGMATKLPNGKTIVANGLLIPFTLI